MRSMEIDNKARSPKVMIRWEVALPAGSDWSAFVDFAAGDNQFWDKYVDKPTIARRTSPHYREDSSRLDFMTDRTSMKA